MATPLALRSRSVSMTQSPERSDPDRPATDAHHWRAWSSDAGFPRVAPSTSRTLSQPSTIAPAASGRAATASALRSARVTATPSWAR